MSVVKPGSELKRLFQEDLLRKTALVLLFLTGLMAILIIGSRFPAADLVAGTLFGLAIGGILAVIAYRKFQLSNKSVEILQSKLQGLEKKSDEIESQLEALINLTRAFGSAEGEQEVIEKVLEASVQITRADFASLVPFDEHRLPITVFRYGSLSGHMEEAWIEYLASPIVRDGCHVCTNQGKMMHRCPLIETGGFFANIGKPAGVFCLPLWRGEKEYGVLNLFFASELRLSDSQIVNLKALLDGSVLLLESMRLQRREAIDRTNLKALHLGNALEDVQAELLEIIQDMTGADFVMLWSKEEALDGGSKSITRGDLPALIQDEVDRILKLVSASGQVYLSESNGQIPARGDSRLSLIAFPIKKSVNLTSGVLLIANFRSKLSRNSRLYLRNMADQISVLAQALDSVIDIEVEAIRQERIRLAREIHDGLAQTLAYLKIHALQMQTMVEAGESERLREALRQSYRVISEAYLDIRQEIDDLRLASESGDFGELIKQTLQEFEETSGVEVNLRHPFDDIELPNEFQPQVIRIVQEALSNIRKHAHATQVVIDWKRCGEMIQIEIEDDGIGFCPEDIPQASRYGLRGMQERAALIGADLVVESSSKAGTTIRLNLSNTLGNQN